MRRLLDRFWSWYYLTFHNTLYVGRYAQEIVFDNCTFTDDMPEWALEAMTPPARRAAESQCVPMPGADTFPHSGSWVWPLSAPSPDPDHLVNASSPPQAQCQHVLVDVAGWCNVLSGQRCTRCGMFFNATFADSHCGIYDAEGRPLPRDEEPA